MKRQATAEFVRHRQRHKLKNISVDFVVSSFVVVFLLQEIVTLKSNCQPQDAISASSDRQQTSSQLQYNRRRSSTNPSSNLVNNNNQLSQMLAQPLTRQQQQQGADLDNVIETTTSTLSLHQNVAAKFIDGSSSSIQSGLCQLPPTWTGKWYQSNKEPIVITNTEITDKGVCRDSKGDKYLFEYVNKQQSADARSCLVCLRFIDRHLNALQYKESSCQPIPANYLNRSTQNLVPIDDHSLLDSICDDINGDNPLESLFRLDAPAIECPIIGQYLMSHDSCREAQSTLDSCIDKRQLNFKYSACSDASGNIIEGKTEALKCYADWLDNSENDKYYMIGRLEYASNPQDRGKFRCFVYEKSADGRTILMSSQDDSCNGLISPTETGQKTLRLTVKPPTTHRCYFPSYIQSQSENWLSVDNSLIYMFNPNSTKYQVKETKEGSIIEEATCLQQFTHPHPNHQAQPLRLAASAPNLHQNRRYPASTSSNSHPQADQQATTTSRPNDAVYLVQITKNCYITNYCVRFYKRSNGIVQIDYFAHTPNSDHPCRNAYIKESVPQTQIITSTNLEHQRCPFEGAYTIEAPIESDFTYNPSNIFVCPRQSYLTAQCDHFSRLRVHSRCSPTKNSIKNLYCLGSWTTNGLVRLLLADDERQRYSAWYKDYAVPLMPQSATDTAITTVQPLDHFRSAASTPTNLDAQIVDLQIALITPAPIIAKPMQVRLTRRNQCSDLRGYTSQGSYTPGGSASMPSYAPSLTAQSGSASTVTIPATWYHSIVICSSILLVIVHLKSALVVL